MATFNGSPAVWIGTIIRPRAALLVGSARRLARQLRSRTARARRLATRGVERAWSRAAPIRAASSRGLERTMIWTRARSARMRDGTAWLVRQQPFWGVAFLVAGVALAYASGPAALVDWQRMYLSALLSIVGLLYLVDWRREAGSKRLLSDLHEVRWSLSFLHGRLDTKLLKDMQRLSDNVEDLDDRALVRLRLTAKTLLSRVRDELEVRSALDPFREDAAEPELCASELNPRG